VKLQKALSMTTLAVLAAACASTGGHVDCMPNDGSPNICCAVSCGVCGGPDCANGQDPADCCVADIATTAPFCDPLHPVGPCVMDRPDFEVSLSGTWEGPCTVKVEHVKGSPNTPYIDADRNIAVEEPRDLVFIFKESSKTEIEFDWQIFGIYKISNEDDPCLLPMRRKAFTAPTNIFLGPVDVLSATTRATSAGQERVLLIDDRFENTELVGAYCYYLGIIGDCDEKYTQWGDPKIYNKPPIDPPGGKPALADLPP
jgi:hypothetical protein